MKFLCGIKNYPWLRKKSWKIWMNFSFGKKKSIIKEKIMENMDDFVSKRKKLSPLKEKTWKT